jgi:hypothetical protein
LSQLLEFELGQNARARIGIPPWRAEFEHKMEARTSSSQKKKKRKERAELEKGLNHSFGSFLVDLRFLLHCIDCIRNFVGLPFHLNIIKPLQLPIIFYETPRTDKCHDLVL